MTSEEWVITLSTSYYFNVCSPFLILLTSSIGIEILSFTIKVCLKLILYELNNLLNAFYQRMYLTLWNTYLPLERQRYCCNGLNLFENLIYFKFVNAQTAEVKRNAAVGVANSERDAGIRESECQKAAMDIKFSADSKIEDSTRQFLTQKAQYDTEVNYKKADASLAYDLESTRIDQQIAFEKKQIDLVQRKKQIIIQEQENTRIEKEIQGDIRLVADAQAHAIKEKAAGSKSKVIAEAEANARKLQIIGEAQARAIEAKGLAEAEEMRIKAAAYKQYGDAAILALTLDSLPKVCYKLHFIRFIYYVKSAFLYRLLPKLLPHFQRRTRLFC